MKLEDFIVQHGHDDPAELVLQRDRWPDIDVKLAAECIASRRKLRSKVPEWYADAGMMYPLQLSAEQCSSTATAAYKAALAAKWQAHRSIADLTGGLGIDCWQFSSVTDKVLYNEMNPALLDAAKRNLPRAGCGNIEFSGEQVGPENLERLLDSFRPGLVFADPARRDGTGGKVFLPEDCSPDMTVLQDIILQRGIPLMVKLSPMADISMLLRKFHHVRELHIIQTDGECKELLLVAVDGPDTEPLIVVSDAGSGRIFDFLPSQERGAVPVYISAPPRSGSVLFEPGPAVSKSGAFNLVCEHFGMAALGPSAHLYVAGNPVPEARDAGKWFRILDVKPFGKAAMKEFALTWPDAEASARSLPINSDHLRLRMGLRGGGRVHIFGTGTTAGRLLIAAERV